MKNKKYLFILLVFFSVQLFAQKAKTSDANEVALFLAGKPSVKYAKLQKKQWYKTHKSATKTGWNKFTKNTISQINKWNATARISDETDNSTLFYPFSGPDFLYANAFFPACKNYIMLGLEQPGNLPNFNTIPDSTINVYLTNIRKSLRYINKTGYFVTKQMLKQFSGHNLDGTIHVLLYYLAQSNCKVIETTKVYIDKKAILRTYSTYPGKEYITGNKISFKKKGELFLRTIYYFRVNANNNGMDYRPEFLKFVGSFGRLATYMKSASYLMHNKEFERIRTFVLENSYKIFQDDSGISFADLSQQFDVRIFGKYSKTIKDFDYLFQEDLKKALKNEKRPKKLPFKIGYNRWHNETVLMYAVYNPNKKYIAVKSNKIKKKGASTTHIKQKKTENKIAKNKNELVYKIQIKMTSIPIVEKDFFGDLKYKTEVYIENGKYKYTIGNSATYAGCKKMKIEAKKAGFTGAFTVAFYNGKRISIKDALKMSQ